MQITKEQINELKTSIDNIQVFGTDCWQEIVTSISIREYESNEYFSQEGETIKCLGYILSGVLRIFYLSEKGDEWNKHFLQKSDFVAATVSIEEKSITNIQALSKTKIFCIPHNKFLKLADKYQEINSFIQKLSFSYLEQKQNREIQLLSQDALDNYLSFKRLYPNLEDNIQYYHIASYLGITPTQLSRIRQKIATNQHM